MKNKLISLILAICILLGTVSPVFAAGPTSHKLITETSQTSSELEEHNGKLSAAVEIPVSELRQAKQSSFSLFNRRFQTRSGNPNDLSHGETYIRIDIEKFGIENNEFDFDAVFGTEAPDVNVALIYPDGSTEQEVSFEINKDTKTIDVNGKFSQYDLVDKKIYIEFDGEKVAGNFTFKESSYDVDYDTFTAVFTLSLYQLRNTDLIVKTVKAGNEATNPTTAATKGKIKLTAGSLEKEIEIPEGSKKTEVLSPREANLKNRKNINSGLTFTVEGLENGVLVDKNANKVYKPGTPVVDENGIDPTVITFTEKPIVTETEPRIDDPENPGTQITDPDYVAVTFAAGEHGTIVANKTYYVFKGVEMDSTLTPPAVTANNGWTQKTGTEAWNPALATKYDTATEHVAQYKYNGPDVVPQPGNDIPDVPSNFVLVEFKPGDHGTLSGTTKYWVNPDANKTLEHITKPGVTANDNYKFTVWDKADTTAITEALEVTAKYIKDGQEIVPGTDLPDGVFEVKVLRDETSIKDNALYGKSYAVFKDSKLAQDKFPTPEAEENFKDPSWNVKNPWDQAITTNTDFKASAVSSAFNKDKVTKIEFTKDPTKMTYTEGDKPEHDGLEITLTDENGNTQVVTKDKLGEFGITVTPAEATELAKSNNGNHFVAKVNDKDGKEIEANSPGTITVNDKISDTEVIPYEPEDKDNPTNPDDKNIPTEDDKGKIDKSQYNIVAFKTEDIAKGKLELGDLKDKEVISVLVKKGSKWDKVTVPATKPVDDTVKFLSWDPTLPESTVEVENGKVYTAKFVKDGQEIVPGTDLPDGVFEVKVLRDETSIKDNALYGKSYAVFKDSKLAQDKFPTPEAEENFKDPSWNVKNPWDQAITTNTDFKASAVSSAFNKDKVTKIEFTKDPTKMTYTEGDKPEHDGLEITLTDENGNTQVVTKDKLGEFGITVTPAEATELAKSNDGNHFVAKVNDKDGKEIEANSPGTITVNDKISDTEVIPYEPEDKDNPTNPDDKNIPTEDDKGKIDKSQYNIVAFKTEDIAKGKLELGDLKDKEVISVLVKKGSKWDKVTVPATKPVDDTVKFLSWDPTLPESTVEVENGKVYTAKFVKDGQEIVPGTDLPDGVFEVKVLRDETSIKDNALYGKSYAVFKDSKLAQDKFPTPEAEENFKDPSWNVKNPWDQAITTNTDFKASAVSSAFNKDKVTKIEFTKDPTKMTYTEGDKPEHDGLEITLTDENGNTQVVTKDKLGEFGITVTPAEATELAKSNDGNHFVAKVNDKDGKEIEANSPGTITVNDKISDTEVIPYEPEDKDNPTNPDDKNIPTEDDKGKIDKSQYNIVAFKTEDIAKGKLELGDLKDKEVISVLVKKGSKWDKVTVPATKPVDDTVKFLSWDPTLPESTVEVENGKVYTAKFVKDGQEIVPGTDLPDGVFEVKVLRDETSIKDNALYGKSYAVFKDSKLAQDKFPTPEAEENFKDPSWNVKNPWDQAITTNTDFKASAVSSAFNKDKVTKIEFTKDPTKMTYTEGDKPEHDGLEITLTDENGNTQVVTKDKLGEFGITVTPAEATELAKSNNGNHFVAKVNDKDGKEIEANSPGTITVNDKISDTEVIPYEPEDKDNPTNPDDKNIPTEDDKGKIDKSQYNIVAFKTEDIAKGKLELGDLKDKEVISVLVKKGSKWDKVTVPATKPVDDTVKFLSWDPTLPESTVEVENGKVYTAKFVKDGQEIVPGTDLPDGVFEVKVLRDETSIKDNALYGKSYAVFKDSKLAQDKFPTPEAEENFKDPSWNVKNPWDQAITTNTDFKASAVSSAFNKDKVTKIEFTKDPTKMTYTEGDKPEHDGLEITLTDENGNTQVVTKDKLGEFGITVTPAEATELAKSNNGNHFVAKVNDKDGKEIEANSPGTITVNDKQAEESTPVTDPKQTPNTPDGKPTVEVTIPEGVEPGTVIDIVKEKEDGTTEVVGNTTIPEDKKPGDKITIPLDDDKTEDKDVIKVVTTEPDKKPSESKTKVTLDKKGPEFTHKDENGQTVIGVIVKQEPYSYEIKIDTTAKDDTGILKIYYEGTDGELYYLEEASEKTVDLSKLIKKAKLKDNKIKLVAEDKFGNKTEFEADLNAKPEPLIMKAERPYDGDDFLAFKTEKNASVVVKVLRGGTEIFNKTITASGEFDEIDLDSDLEKGDIVIYEAKLANKVGKMKQLVR